MTGQTLTQAQYDRIVTQQNANKNLANPETGLFTDRQFADIQRLGTLQKDAAGVATDNQARLIQEQGKVTNYGVDKQYDLGLRAQTLDETKEANRAKEWDTQAQVLLGDLGLREKASAREDLESASRIRTTEGQLDLNKIIQADTVNQWNQENTLTANRDANTAIYQQGIIANEAANIKQTGIRDANTLLLGRESLASNERVAQIGADSSRYDTDVRKELGLAELATTEKRDANTAIYQQGIIANEAANIKQTGIRDANNLLLGREGFASNERVAQIGADASRYDTDVRKELGLADIGSREKIAGMQDATSRYGIDTNKDISLRQDATARYGIDKSYDQALAGFATQKEIASGDQSTRRYEADTRASSERYGVDSNERLGLAGYASQERMQNTRTQGDITIAGIGADASKYAADKNAWGQVESTRLSADANKYAADKDAGARMYSADAQARGQIGAADRAGFWNNESAKTTGQWNVAATAEAGKWNVAAADTTGKWNQAVADTQGRWNVASTAEAGKWNVANTAEAGKWNVAATDAAGKWNKEVADTEGQWNLRNTEATVAGNLAGIDKTGEWNLKGIAESGKWNVENTRAAGDENVRAIQASGAENRSLSAQESGQRITEADRAVDNVIRQKNDDRKAALRMWNNPRPAPKAFA
jgi:hypothetical protein